MSSRLPERVEVARAVQGGRSFEGELSLSGMRRLRDSLASEQGTVRFRIEFGADESSGAWLDLQLEAELPLTCQRTLEVFGYPVRVSQRMGIIGRVEDEAALPEGYEPLLVEDGSLDLAEVIEDELILALPVVAVKPGAPLDWVDAEAPPMEEERENPFAALEALRKKKG